ncbi:hypothetical protein [Laspinema olomoucense]|uniref:hypothetical protein n=1 Tax=Laspinema olomoucense TaxID=3231600 RepID=UPI0021BBA018|nr:hypothetical protein [Laspinema sp. D3c]MCT7994791.1 hypothetical protein [Laspinema sp. D3c]
MKDSTETLLMFAQLLEAEPPILPPEACQQAQKLAAELETVSEADINRAADMIRTWMGQFPQEQKVFLKAIKRELNGIPNPNQVQWTFPNLQIIEETETTALIIPAPNAEKISLFVHVIQTLNRWIQKKI